MKKTTSTKSKWFLLYCLWGRSVQF